MMQGSHYKQELREPFREPFRVPFSPFSFFSEFVFREVKARNNLSFHLIPSTILHNRSQRFTESPSNAHYVVSVHKTDILSSSRLQMPTAGVNLLKHPVEETTSVEQEQRLPGNVWERDKDNY
ncbi:hypothetical protein NHX12_013496 [Muraenolepis orangiensis]|uniref:Uncharacterized protein n=1 Tax=Muraenolepis orangiensis TaxID=630683 RepID=A0A9Q0DEZ0_9TELE|nr:hypothetical protein NHX12_013496 [Muraenolepis orangiensis]